VLWVLRVYLDSWAGIGRITVGMARQSFDFQLTRYDDRAAERRSTRPEGALANKRNGHRLGAHALARDAAGGVAGVEERGSS